MVATLLSLRWRMLTTQLGRSPLQFAAVLIGLLVALGLLAALLPSEFALGTAIPVVRDAALVPAGAVLTLGWWVLPVIATGIDQSLDPVRLAPYPVRRPELLVALALAGVLGVPGLTSGILALGTALTWRDEPVAALAAVACAPVALLTAVIGSRVAATFVGALSSGGSTLPRLAGIAAVVAGALASPVAALLAGFAVRDRAGPADGVLAVADVLARTPLGAAWAIPGELGTGRPIDALVSAGIALATLVALVAIWPVAISAATERRASGGTGRSGRSRGGLLRLMPGGRRGPVAAIAARTALTWLRDPRLARQLMVLPVLPALFVVSALLYRVEAFAVAAAPVAGGLLSVAAGVALSYDGPAFATHLAAGVRGRDDRVGRAIGTLVLAAPLVAIVSVLALAVVGRLELVPAELGLALGSLLVGAAVASVSSALIVVPVPASGRRAFSAPPGAQMSAIGSSYLVASASAALSTPVIVLGVIAAATDSPALGVAALVVGLVGGSVLLAGGITLGGRVLDATGPRMLERIRRYAE